MATLYIVSTPIGNLEDVTQRALTVLRSVDRALAEDTRHTAILLRRYEVRVPLVSLHEHNEAARAGEVVGWLAAGENLALVSDAGTPLLSDPGERLVNAVLAAGYDVVPVPGASALLAALVAGGLPTSPFTFFGFPPRSGTARAELLRRLVAADHTTVCYESPNRLGRLLEDLSATGAGERRAVVARELTKVHEEFRRGTVLELAAYYAEHPLVRGEVVLLLEGGVSPPAPAEAAEELARALLAEGLPASTAARELARRLQLRRNQAYQIIQEVGGKQEKAQ
jgi:16S rRNA (cytidine1402-2'-O)-methyltransferase